jgi:FemAB-related protein (PEP-CTERM system-associated)
MGKRNSVTDNTFTLRLANDTDALKWDDFVENHPQASPYHRMAWLHAVKKSYGFDPMPIVAECDQTKKFKGILPVVRLTTPLKGASLCALPYCDFGGPLVSVSESESESESDVQSKIVEFAVQLLKSENASYLEVRTCAHDEDTNNELAGQKVRMLLELPDSADTLLASFKSKLRSQIRKAEKNGLSYKIGNNAQLLEDFYRVYCINMRDLGSPAHHKDWFSEITACYGENAIISVVYHDSLPIGGGIVLLNKYIAAIPWASTIQAYNKLAPNMLLYWSLLAYCADKQIHTFDFGRSTYNEGTYKFKKQWGATPRRLNWECYQKDGTLVAQEGAGGSSSNSSLRETVETVWRKLPLPLTVFIGGKIRKYISL